MDFVAFACLTCSSVHVLFPITFIMAKLCMQKNKIEKE